MCQHFENTHRRYSPSISGKRKEHQRYFCQVGWSFYYPCPSPADAPASIRPWLALANPLYSPFPGHFSALSSCHVHSSLCSKSFGESIRYSIFEKTVKFGKNIPAQEKIFNENLPEYISQELQSLPNRAMIGKTILARYAAGQPLPAHRMVNSNRLTPEKERVRL